MNQITLTPIDELPKPRMSMRQTMACIDDKGRIRCPTCGKYAKMGDIIPIPSMKIYGGIVSLLPACKKCCSEDE